MDTKDQELDFLDKAIKKIVNIEGKTLLQPPLDTQKIDAKCFQGYKPVKKEDKNSEKNKYTGFFPTNIPSKKQFTY